MLLLLLFDVVHVLTADFFFVKNAAMLGCPCSSGHVVPVGLAWMSMPSIAGNLKRGWLRAFFDLSAAVDCFRNHAASFLDGCMTEFDDGCGCVSSMVLGLSSMICWARFFLRYFLGRQSLVGPGVLASEFDDLSSVGGRVVSGGRILVANNAVVGFFFFFGSFLLWGGSISILVSLQYANECAIF
jgi:hypothetical protein